MTTNCADESAASCCTEDQPQNTVNLTVKDPQGEEIYFKVKRTAKMRRLFGAYCKRSGIDPATMRFFHQGERLNEDQTPDDLGLKDGDVIDAFVRQVAGAPTHQQ